MTDTPQQKIAADLDRAADIFLNGLQPGYSLPVEPFPGLREGLKDGDKAARDEWAAEHYRVFGMNVFPFASAFLDGSRMLGGRATEQAITFYRDGGYQPASSSESPDHIGHELRFAVHLLQQGNDGLLGRFLQTHLLAWFPPFTLAVRRQGSPFFGSLAADSLTAIQACLDGAPDTDPEMLLPPPANLLDSPDTGLKDIAEFFLTPVFAGIYLSRDNIAALGRETGMPRGFGSRVQMLVNLFRAGVDYGQLETIFQKLRVEIEGWAADYKIIGEEATLQPFARTWEGRARNTLQISEAILDELRTGSSRLQN